MERKSSAQQAREAAAGLNYDDVEPSDKDMVMRIMENVYLMNDPIPRLEVDIYNPKNSDHYVVSIRKLRMNPISDTKWYDVFLNPQIRDTRMDSVIDSHYEDAPLDGTRGMKILKIRKRTFRATSRRK